ncbi:unnamed protein product [Caretta caretta]
MAILVISAVGTIMIGGYWAGLAMAAKPQHTEHQDEEDEECSDKAADCTLTMICVTMVYYVACTIAYGTGLLGTFAVRALLQIGQPALLYLVPLMLITSLFVAFWHQELTLFWTSRGFEKNLPYLPLEKAPASYPQLSNNSTHQHLNKRESKKRPIPYSAEKDNRNE